MVSGDHCVSRFRRPVTWMQKSTPGITRDVNVRHGRVSVRTPIRQQLCPVCHDHIGTPGPDACVCWSYCYLVPSANQTERRTRQSKCRPQQSDYEEKQIAAQGSPPKRSEPHAARALPPPGEKQSGTQCRFSEWAGATAGDTWALVRSRRELGAACVTDVPEEAAFGTASGFARSSQIVATLGTLQIHKCLTVQVGCSPAAVCTLGHTSLFERARRQTCRLPFGRRHPACHPRTIGRARASSTA